MKFSAILDFQDKSHIKAGDGLAAGVHPFFTSSPVLSKFLDTFQFEGESLILGTGGNASIHYYEHAFSVSTDCLVAVLNDEQKHNFDTKFIYYYLLGNIKLLENGFKGAGLKHISKSYINDIDIPTPTLEKQKQIVGILDEANLLRQKRKESIGLLDEYLKSVFLDMFGDPVNNSNDLTVELLENLAEIRSGVTKGRKLEGKFTIDVPYMRVANVQDGFIDLREIKTIKATVNDIEKYKLEVGDLLLTEGGDPDKLGRGGIWRGEIEDCIHQNHIFRVRFDHNIVAPEYASALISSPHGKRYFLKSAKQTTGIATINSTQLKKFPFLLPELTLQNQFAGIVKNAELIKQKMLTQSKELDHQFQALMQKAFKHDVSN